MLSVIIITKNEATTIERCLQSIQWVDEIIILDSGSTDQTCAIAARYTQKIYTAEDWQGYGIQKERALQQATGDWILNLDADESVDEVLKEAILQAIASNEADAYRIPICMYFYGKALRHSASPKRHIRLFKRKGAHYSQDIVHEKILLPREVQVGRLSAVIRHHSYRDVTHALFKLNRYSSYSAKIRLKQRNRPNFYQVLFSAGWMFFRCFVLQRGFLDGKEGFLFAIFSMEGTFYRGIKQLYPDKQIEKLPPVETN